MGGFARTDVHLDNNYPHRVLYTLRQTIQLDVVGPSGNLFGLSDHMAEPSDCIRTVRRYTRMVSIGRLGFTQNMEGLVWISVIRF